MPTSRTRAMARDYRVRRRSDAGGWWSGWSVSVQPSHHSISGGSPAAAAKVRRAAVRGSANARPDAAPIPRASGGRAELDQRPVVLRRRTAPRDTGEREPPGAVVVEAERVGEDRDGRWVDEFA